MCVMNRNDSIRCRFIAFVSGLQLHSAAAAAMTYDNTMLRHICDVSIFMTLYDHNIYNLRYIYGC